MNSVKDLFKGCLTIPNLLSVIRILLVPVFAVLFLKDYKIIALIILAVSGLTDCFDGKIARRFNQVSALGKILDPVADKITQITIAIMLLILFRGAEDPMIRAFGWVFLVFLIKEGVMIVGGLIMILWHITPGAAEIYGKIATAAFYGIMILIIGFGPEVGAFVNFFQLPSLITGILVVISAILTIVAFASYVPGIYSQFHEYFANKKQQKNK